MTFFLYSENIDTSSNELSIELSLNKVYSNPFPELKNMEAETAKNLLIAHLNVNSLRNKYVSFEELVKGNTDILLISETKFDETFPNKQFGMQGLQNVS